MPVSGLGGISLAPGGSNPMLQNFAQGLQVGYMPQQQQADIALKKAQAEQALGRGAYYDAYGNLRQNQSQYGTGSVGQLVQLMQNNPQLANDPTMVANIQQAITRQTQYGGAVSGTHPAYLAQQIQTMEQMDPNNPALPQLKEVYQQQIGQLRANVQKTGAQAGEAQARGGYYEKGGARGATLDYLKNSGELPPDIAAQAAVSTALQGASPEVKRQFEYNAAAGNPTLQASIQGANLKSTSNQQLLRQQAAMEQFDAAVEPMIQDVGNAVAHYSGPGGALRLKADQFNQASGKPASAEYQAYLLAMQTQIPLMADNARKILGAQASDAMQEQLQGIIGPGGKPDMKTLALMPPEVVQQKLEAFSQYLKRETEVGRNFVGPLSMDPATEKKLNQDLSGITSTMQNQQQSQGAGASPPPGLSKEQFSQWYAQHGGK